jgi:hypothetical protein
MGIDVDARTRRGRFHRRRSMTPPEAAPMREDVTQEAWIAVALAFEKLDPLTFSYTARRIRGGFVDRWEQVFVSAIVDRFRDRLVHTARPDAGEGYAAAFYEIAAMLGIPARAASPADVWHDEMRPKLEALVSRPDAGDEVERVAKMPVYVDLPPIWQFKAESALGNFGSAFGVHPQVRGPIAEAVWNVVREYAISAMREGVDRGMVERGWQPIDTCPMWQVAIVTDGENVAKAQKAEADFDSFYWSVDPEDCLEWEPTHWIEEPAAALSRKGGQANGQ